MIRREEYLDGVKDDFENVLMAKTFVVEYFDHEELVQFVERHTVEDKSI